MRLLDLFSGIGGFSLGLERAGFTPVAFCEILPKCRHLLATHWPLVPCYDDILALTGDRLAADGIGVDAICGGFPCQDVSLAGPGGGVGGSRSGLYVEYIRLIRELRPRVIVMENVSALLGRGLGVVLGELAALGYDAWWDCIPASAVGAPHQRDRVWIVAYARGQQHEGYGDALRREIAKGLHEAHLADPARVQPGRSEQRSERQRARQGGEPIALGDPSICGRHAASHPGPRQHQGRQSSRPPRGSGGHGGGQAWWQSEPDVGRVAHGVPARVDRLHGLGNAVVPEIPEIIGRAIIEAERIAA